MKTLRSISPQGLLGKLTATIVLLIAFAINGSVAHAATSGGAVVYNEATVTFTSGASVGLTATDDESVTVATLAAAPTVSSSSAGLTILAGADAVYTLTITSNSNGDDTYTGSVNSQVNTGVSAPTDAYSGTASLWGGIVSVANTTNNRLELPGGSLGGLVNGETVVLNIAAADELYTVTIFRAGNAESSGVAEITALVDLTQVGGAPVVDTNGGNVAVGDQVGEQRSITFTQTGGTPSAPGTDGTHAQNARITTTATLVDDATAATTDTAITTTVSSPAVTILKEARNLDALVPTWVSNGTTTAKTGERIEYRITLTNTHASATATDVFVTDTIPSYTTLQTGQYGGEDVQMTYSVGPVVTTATSANDGDEAELTGSSFVVTVGTGAGDAGTQVGGTIAAGGTNNVVVLFRVTVN